MVERDCRRGLKRRSCPAQRPRASKCSIPHHTEGPRWYNSTVHCLHTQSSTFGHMTSTSLIAVCGYEPVVSYFVVIRSPNETKLFWDFNDALSPSPQVLSYAEYIIANLEREDTSFVAVHVRAEADWSEH